ncbi:hypothetical protein INR49_008072 [Caranx melampygus]|nr:hypothetical protein INR49_008072 [Caranx melampygus]
MDEAGRYPTCNFSTVFNNDVNEAEELLNRSCEELLSGINLDFTELDSKINPMLLFNGPAVPQCNVIKAHGYRPSCLLLCNEAESGSCVKHNAQQKRRRRPFTVKLKWLEHLNSSWITEDSESIATREGVSVLYSKLLTNKEVLLLPQQVLCLKGPQLPDFERESLSSDEQEHYLDALLSSQLALAKMPSFCSPTPSWMMPPPPSPGGGPGGNINLCNDVIHTAIDVVSSLPPLSLANESKIPPMGLDCLAQVTTFLKG